MKHWHVMRVHPNFSMKVDIKKIYYLKSCDTCKRILKPMDLTGITLREIKSDPVTEEELNEMFLYTNSYEALFNKRAKLYKELDLKNQTLSDHEYKQLILKHYTFLKRPLAIMGSEIYVGNSKKTVAKLYEIHN